MLLVVEIVLGRVAVEEKGEDLRGARAKLHRLAGSRGGLLGDPPDFRVFQWILWIMLDLAGDARPAPGFVNGIEHRADRIREQRRTGLLSLQFLVLETFPALEHVMMPGAARDVLVEVIIAGRENVETRAGLIGDHDGVCIGELFAIPRVHHGGVEGTSPHVHIVPARARPGAGDGCRKHEVFGSGECHRFDFLFRWIQHRRDRISIGCNWVLLIVRLIAQGGDGNKPNLHATLESGESGACVSRVRSDRVSTVVIGVPAWRNWQTR